MKQLKEVPQVIVERIKSEHEKALLKLAQKSECCYLPIRLARMRVYRPSTSKSNLTNVIVPPTTIYVHENGLLSDGMFDRNYIRYTVTNTKTPFPFGHIYKDSGHVCLGDIFVPSLIPSYSPQQPLETLFLHNDRNLHHGNASVYVTDDKIKRIKERLSLEGIVLSQDTLMYFDKTMNLLRYDTLWSISVDVLDQTETILQAFQIMSDIYHIILVEVDIPVNTDNNGGGD